VSDTTPRAQPEACGASESRLEIVKSVAGSRFVSEATGWRAFYAANMCVSLFPRVGGYVAPHMVDKSRW